ncbi:MAG: hypothetical protein IJN42_06955 [Clostridia bacterium]|nr:hypothetical protein [Clostridia bacterium]
MKKVFLPLLLVPLLLCAACGECNHEFTTETITPATCSAQGLNRKTCTKCNYIEDEKIPKTEDHAFVSKVTKAATCTNEGTKVDVCSDCAATRSGILPATGHQYKETAKHPTCTQGGTLTKICVLCGDKQTQVLPAKGHQWEDYTCLAPMTCSVCGKSEGDKGPHTTIQGTCDNCHTQSTELTDTIIPAIESMEANLTAAKEYGSKYSAAYPAEANAFYLKRAFASAYNAIADIVDIHNALQGRPAYSNSCKAFLTAYELNVHLDPDTVTTDNVSAKYADYTKYFTQLEQQCSAAYATLHKEANVQNIPLDDYRK